MASNAAKAHFEENKINTAQDIIESKYFCVIPWIHTHILPNSKVIPCCVSHYEDTFGDLKQNKLIDIWNGARYRTMRKLMLADRKVYSCSKCYEVESSNVISMRKRMNSLFRNTSELLQQTKVDGSHPNLQMKYFDIRFSNICNFKCRGCSPALSTSWYDDHQKLWNFNSDKPKLINATNDVSDLWDQLKKFLPTVEVAYFAGGEPLLMEEHYKTLEHLIKIGNTNIRLDYNTNLSVLKFKKYDLINLWSKFDRITLNVSLDDIEERGEYFRSGLKWDRFVSNFKELQEKCPQIEFSVNVTISLFNISRIPEIHSFLYKNHFIDKFSFHFNTLLDPKEYRTQVLPFKDKIKIEMKLLTYLKTLEEGEDKNDWSYFRSSLLNQIHFMKSTDLSSQLKRFKEQTLKLDEIRNESFSQIYPELKHIIEVS